MDNTLTIFDPVIKEWFEKKYLSPTTIQKKAWPKIAGNQNVLISAPTGSGKTLTAFLWALNKLLKGEIRTGYTSVLYISPLKALNNDIRKNLINPLEELKEICAKQGREFPKIEVVTRSGDTSQYERRRMIRKPPEILITTPESINLLLSSMGGRSILGNLDTVILDEIHSVAGTKRGTHLISAVERLTLLSGEFRRISLSATVKPVDRVIGFISGRKISGTLKSPVYMDRKTELVETKERKNYSIKVVFPLMRSEVKRDSIWDTVCEDLKEVIDRNRSTLIFTNGRNLCEKIAYKLNKIFKKEVSEKTVFSHHGSLSREIRSEVEKRFKEGNINAIVATNSLEMGIDIGDLDEVILIQSPPSVSSAVQRVGRAGHSVDVVSCGTFYPSHAMDILESAVLAKEIVSGEIEDLKPVDSPLDVLSQIIVSMVGVETWDIDELYNFLISINPYRNLSFKMFSNVLAMLSGKYEDSRIRELSKKVIINKKDNSVKASKGALLSLYLAGGTIPDRGYYKLRDLNTSARIGELDEEYVWEASPGQILTIGAQNFRIKKITHNDVFVVPAKVTGLDVPFWIGESRNRDSHFSERISDLLSLSDEMLEKKDGKALFEILENEHKLSKEAAEKLIEFLKIQRKRTNSSLPHRKHLLIEEILSGPGRTPYHQTVVHTFWGGRLNKPYAIALKAAFEDHYKSKIEVISDNNCIVLMLPEKGLSFENLVNSENLEIYLREEIEKSGFFGARFRECAGRALLIGKQNLNMRMPLWISRLKSKKLLNAVSNYSDFPILTETFRTCLSDEFDIGNLIGELKSIENGDTKITRIKSRTPSPMADNISWEQINKYMYADDSSEGAKKSGLDYDLVSEMVWNKKLKIAVDKDIAESLDKKLRRVWPGYSPLEPDEFLDFVSDCILLTSKEWDELKKAVKRDHNLNLEESLEKEMVKAVTIDEYFILAEQKLEFILDKGILKDARFFYLNGDPLKNEPGKRFDLEKSAIFIYEWLKFRGPVTIETLLKITEFKEENLLKTLDYLKEEKKLVSGNLIKEDETLYFCEAENYEILLRISRKAREISFETLRTDFLQPFLFHLHTEEIKECSVDNLFKLMEKLSSFPLRCDLWEKEIFPSRFNNYNSAFFDAMMQEEEIIWIGSEPKNILFNFLTDLDLIPQSERYSSIITGDGKRSFKDILEKTGKSLEDLSKILWKEVFRGIISNDTFIPVRKGFENDFKIKPLEQRRSLRRGPSRAGVSIRQASIPNYGNFFMIDKIEKENDPVSAEERRRARVRILLERYGILFREILKREIKEFSWGTLFKTLRIMELSGEILTGRFFDGIDGPQFISPKAFEVLRKGEFKEKLFWINSMDPIAVPSMGLDVPKRSKKRSEGTHFAYHGAKLIMTSVSFAKELFFEVNPDEPEAEESLIVLEHLLSRQFMPKNSLKIETINEVDASKSPYLPILKNRFDLVEDHKAVTIYKKHF